MTDTKIKDVKTEMEMKTEIGVKTIAAGARNFAGSKLRLVAAFVLMVIAGTLGCNNHENKSATAGDDSTQTTFATPAQAAQALQAASRDGYENGLARILGPKSKAILSSGDPAEDKAALESFVAKFAQMNRWVPMTDGSQILNIGADNYPFPIPLVQDSSGKWFFNTAAGADEILARRIGQNELLAIDACGAIGNAEEIYFRTPRDGSPAHEYTSMIISSPGKQDGLYWQGQDSSPLGKLDDFASSELSSATSTAPPVIDGYSFRILTAQGDKAKGGARSYLVNGKMTNGFAVIASPVTYRDSGVMTFILSREGVVYEKDLGPNTVALAASIKDYNPSHDWTPVEADASNAR
jgi:hypothetical protein